MNRDFAACGGHNCPIKERCKRYRIGQEIIKKNIPGYWTMARYDEKKNDCELFVNEEYENVDSKR